MLATRCHSLGDIAGVCCLVLMTIATAIAGQPPTALPPKAPSATRVALLGCLRQNEPAPALDAYTTLGADLAIWVGDNIYADAKDDPGIIKQCYDTLGAMPAFRTLKGSTPFAVTWDDHDYGDNNEDKDYIIKKESAALFRSFWELGEEIPSEQQGVYYSERYDMQGHRLAVILLDVRYHRDPPDANGDMLGEDQWKWLESELAIPADLTMLVSGSQVLLDAEGGSETWDQYPRARARLFETIRRSRAQNLVLVTGDQHYAEAARLRSALDFDAVELQFAGINQIEDAEFSSYRVAGPSRSLHTVGFVDIQWDASPFDPPHLLYRVFDAADGRMELSYRLNFDELRLTIVVDGDREFLDGTTLRMSSPRAPLAIRYTLDGSEPTAASPLFVDSLQLTETTTVRAALFDASGWPRTASIASTFAKVAPKAAVPTPDGAVPGLAYSYYEGEFTRVPDFSHLSAAERGIAASLQPSKLARRKDHYALLFEGWLLVPRTGMYEFQLVSDDGSRLHVGGRLVVDNDGSHSKRRRTGRIALAEGAHFIGIEYFEDYMGQALEVHWGPVGEEPAELTATDVVCWPGNRQSP